MYKTTLVQKVAKETRLSQRIVNDVLTESLKAIQQALRQGESVTFPGFGTFYTSERKEGTVRHIRTGEVLRISARRVAAFRVGALLKQAVRKHHRAAT